MTKTDDTPPFDANLLTLSAGGDDAQHLYMAEPDQAPRPGRMATALCGRPRKHTGEPADLSAKTCPDCLERVERIKRGGLYNLTNLAHREAEA